MDPSEEDSNLSWMDPSDFYSHALSTPQRRHFRISKFIGIRHCFLNYPYFFLKELPRFDYFGLFDSLMYWVLMYWVLVSGNFCSPQDSNLRRKALSDFESDAWTFGHDCTTVGFSSVSVTVCLTAVWAFTFVRFYVKTFFLTAFDRLIN